ncbi:MAG TPA: putative baseplate assembly protein [Blastocatellia bacterium]|nr:putative baseplate assembly protein [Blastocatellia bacterium]
MGSSVDPTTNLNDCGCCEGISAETPARIDNRPGLGAVVYRAGTHAQFKDTMLARLSASGQAALGRLTTRDDDDFTIALLDAWATIGDVLTFYQERLANEAYLRTATERFSVLELARLIDYQLRPGVAASTYLAFALEDAPGTLGQALSIGTTAQTSSEPLPPIVIDVGTKVQSVPAPGEQAQTFETVEQIDARAEWNALKPRLVQPQQLSKNMGSAVFQGTATNLKPGDKLLIDAANGREVRTVLNVTLDDAAQTTRIDFETPGLSPATYTRPSGLTSGKPTDFPAGTVLNETTVQAIITKKWSEEDLAALARMQNWSLDSLVANINQQTAGAKFTGGTGVFAFRQRAAIFGHNAPKWDSLPANLRFGQSVSVYKDDGSGGAKFDKFKFVPAAFPLSWETRTLEDDAAASGNSRFVFLDNTYQGIVKDGWLVLAARTGAPQASKITDHLETTRTDFSISAKVSRVAINAGSLSAFKMRETVALVQSEALLMATVPIIDVAQGNNLTLDRAYLGLKAGQKVVLTGERADLKGVHASELLTIKEVIVERGFTVLTFDHSLAYPYVRNTVTINANVALATHGETVQEVLGGGDANQAFQRFVLRQPPLTYVSASTPSGAETTLEIRVNDVLWHEVPSFFDHGSEERIYITRLDDDGKTTVIFGDGTTGARLPTGQENVKARYRKGIGLGGLVRADQLTQLMTRPLGVKGVTNPLSPEGAADPEKLAEARRNAPLAVLTLGRVVSLKDYEDFARAFSGIDKALATWTWFGQKRGVFVTVSGSKGAEVKDGSELHKSLVNAIRRFGDPLVQLAVKSYQPRLFRVTAAVQVDPDYLPEKVLAQVGQKLRETYSFDARSFGQPVHLSEVIGVMQNVRGVVAVEVSEFYRSDLPVDRKTRIAAAVPLQGDDQVFPAELLTLDPRPLGLEVVK